MKTKKQIPTQSATENASLEERLRQDADNPKLPAFLRAFALFRLEAKASSRQRAETSPARPDAPVQH